MLQQSQTSQSTSAVGDHRFTRRSYTAGATSNAGPRPRRRAPGGLGPRRRRPCHRRRLTFVMVQLGR